jgi:glycerol-1-phosphate dehydrogenase [NAD(P)+]
MTSLKTFPELALYIYSILNNESEIYIVRNLLKGKQPENVVHRIDLPRIVLVGESILEKTCEVCHEFGAGKALIVTGETTYKVAGKDIAYNLEKSGVQTECTFIKDATLFTVGQVIHKIQEGQTDILLGVGGGRNIDVAKASSARTGKQFISIPTVASHDGIASSLASIKGLGRPYTVKAAPPVAVIMDSKIIQNSPFRYTASGCGDMICKATEVRDWRLAHKENDEYYGAYAASLSLMSSEHVMKRAELIKKRTQEGIRTLLEALVSCGVAMSIAGSSRPTSGSAHLFSHALDNINETPALHGEQCGVGGIMMAKLHGLDWREMKEKLQIIGTPTTADELGIDDAKIIEALTIARSIRPERYTILNKINMTREKAIELAKSTEVI